MDKDLNPQNRQPRPKIGFFVAELEGEYCSQLCKGVHDAAEKLDANLIIFPGKAIDSPYKFQYQLNVIYDLADAANLDVLIISNSILNYYLQNHSLSEFYQLYRDIPAVSISFSYGNMPGILINNKAGLYQGLEHLIRMHHKKRIAFIRGPETNLEAEERYNVYLQILDDNNIPFDESLVYQGDFSQYSAIGAVREFFDVRRVQIDALAAANDEMALKAMELMITRGIKVPEDISVIGFDDVAGAKLAIPSLTTVSQPVYEMGRKAMETAVHLFQRGNTGNIILDTSLVVRESCGCLSQSDKKQDDKGLADAGNRDPMPVSSDLSIQAKKPEQDKLIADNQNMAQFTRQLYRYAEKTDGWKEGAHEILACFNRLLHESEITDEGAHFLQALLKKLRMELGEGIKDSETLKTFESLFQDLKDHLVDGIQQNNALRWGVHHTDLRVMRTILEMMVLNLNNKEELFTVFNTELKVIDIHNCYVFLYDQEIVYEREANWVPPETVYLAMACDKNGVLTMDPDKSRMPYKDILSVHFFNEGPQYSLAVNPITFMQEQMGFVFCDFIMRDFYLYETLFIEVSCAIKLYFLLNYQEQIQRKLRVTLNELEDSNRKLNFISQTDELTGLYNRRGFLNLARQNLELARNMNKSGLLFFADLDGLKKINDTYGHEEGDKAIQKTAEVLRKSFRNADILSRLGGDEFTVFTVNTDSSVQEMIEERMQRLLDEINDNSGKPYRISISLGAVQFYKDSKDSIEELMSKADTLLYEQKKLKKRQP